MREIKTKYGPGRIATSADKTQIIYPACDQNRQS